jgi:sucrose phosphorylase
VRRDDARAVLRGLQAIYATNTPNDLRRLLLSEPCETGRESAEHLTILSAYPDQLRLETGDEPPLRSTFASLGALFPSGTLLHILPPYLADPDDSFSIIDDSVVDAALGSWSDLRPHSTHLMLDLVVNQLSSNSPVFRAFADGSGFDDFFYAVPSDFDASNCRLPRGRLPFVPAQVGGRRVTLWSSHGGRQFDLNYRNPAVLEWTHDRLRRLSDTAAWVRLDGLAFAWKDSGTECSNLPQAELLSSTLSTAWRAARPDGCVIAEVDLHPDDMYFRGPGRGPDFGYCYALPPVIASAASLGRVEPLAQVVTDLASRHQVNWINLAVTHDGISLRPWNPVLPSEDLDLLVELAESRGVVVVKRPTGHGRQSAYELDGLPADLYRRGTVGDDFVTQHVGLVNSLLLAIRGLPLLYLPAALGMRSEQRHRKGDARSVVRFRIHGEDSRSLNRRILSQLARMIALRAELPALSASSPMRLVSAEKEVVVFTRGLQGDLTVVHNFGFSPDKLRLPSTKLDLLTNRVFARGQDVIVPPRSAMWLAEHPHAE